MWLDAKFYENQSDVRRNFFTQRVHIHVYEFSLDSIPFSNNDTLNTDTWTQVNEIP